MESGFNAMGKPVPIRRLVNGLAFALSVIDDKYFDHRKFVEDIADALRMDLPNEAMEIASMKLDTTGCYMLLSYLLTGEEPANLCNQCITNNCKHQCSNIGCKNAYEEIMI